MAKSNGCGCGGDSHQILGFDLDQDGFVEAGLLTAAAGVGFVAAEMITEKSDYMRDNLYVGGGLKVGVPLVSMGLLPFVRQNKYIVAGLLGVVGSGAKDIKTQYEADNVAGLDDDYDFESYSPSGGEGGSQVNIDA